jgi:tripartite-type tricarboxylate transporter receptor subunit TctC
MHTRLGNTLSVAAVFLSGLACAQAQETAWPSKNIVIVVATSPGSAGDIYSRLYSQKIGEATGWRFLVDNKPGAGAILGTTFVAKAAPDGYTLLNASSSMTTAPVLYKNVTFDPVKSFSAITLLSNAPSMLLVRSGFPAKSVQEYVAYAKANPGKINFGTTGLGSIAHLTGFQLHRILGVEVTYVPYKGPADISNAIMSGEIHATLGAMTVNLPMVKAGKASILGVSTLTRNRMVPDAPTLSEAGARDFEHDAWTGLVAPAGVPNAIIVRLNAEFQKAGKHPDVVQKLAPTGQLFGGSSIEEFQRLINRETERWKVLAREANLQPE